MTVSDERPQHALPQTIDPVTVVCIAIVAYLLASVIHEGLGHGVTAAVLGARDLRVSSAALHLDSQSVSAEASRAISIAGPLASLFLGLLLAIYHGNTRSKNAEFRYCLWLTAYVCLFQGAGYPMGMSFFHFGDIHGFVKDFDTPFAWRLGLTLLGTVMSFVALYFAGWSMDEFLGLSHRRARAAKLLVISYFAGSIPLILSALLNKSGSYLTLVSAIPATLCGTIFLLYTILVVGEARPSTSAIPLTPGKSLPWYFAGVISLFIYGLVLGPGFPR